MTSELILLLATLATVSVSIITAISGYKRNNKQDVSKDTEHAVESKFKLEAANEKITELKVEIASLTRTIEKLTKDVIILETQVKAANTRLDRINGRNIE